MHQILLTALAALIFLTAARPAAAQDSAGPASPEEWSRALDQLDRRLAHYVDWRRIPELQRLLQDHRAEYLAAPSTDAFISAVNADLYKTSHDRHLQIWAEAHSREDPVRIPGREAATQTAPDYGIRSARREGAVAVLELTEISGDQKAADAIDEAMDLLRGAEALIIDLRMNGGGGEAVQRRLLGHLAPTVLDASTSSAAMQTSWPDPLFRRSLSMF